MKYIIKQKFFSLADRFSINDEYENERFIVNAEFFTIGKKLHLEDNLGNILFNIKQKVFRFPAVYEIYQGELIFATLRKKLSFFKPKIDINQNGTPYYIAGDAFSHEFTVTRNDTVVVGISKKWFAYSDTYGVDISGNENAAFIIALVICIDQIIYSGKK